MASQPGQDWSGRELAALLGIKPRNMLTQLAGWTRLGFLAKTRPRPVCASRPARAGHSLSRRCRRTARSRAGGHHRDHGSDGGSGRDARSLATLAGTVSRTRGHPASPASRPGAQVRSRSGHRKRRGSKPFPARRNGYSEQETAYSQES